jgi:phosphoribosyl-AMP cyclohydrolase
MRIPEDLSYDQNGLIPVIIQDSATKEVLMLAHMNQESLRRTLKGGLTCFWSRSRKEYWVKGATSGNIQRVKAIRVDCDADALLIEVEQVGVACHEGYRSCFFREVLPEGGLQVLLEKPEKPE